MNPVSYRKSIAADLHQIKFVTQEAYGQFNNLLSEENVKHWQSTLSNDATYLDLFSVATAFVAECRSEIVGVAFIVSHDNPYKWFDAAWSYIRLVGVLPGFEGKGIGKKLTQLCIDHAKEMGEKTVALHTSEFQHAARHIYESLGFTKVKEFALFDKKYWVYTLQLS